MLKMKTLLYLTDLYYQAKGRKYYEEDLYITSKLKDHFNILLGHPHQAISYMDCADLIIFRNTGSVLNYEPYFREFVNSVKNKGSLTFNSFDGKADINGKQYLVDLFIQGYPVIPTVDSLGEINNLGKHEKYVVKLLNGADSIGMKFLSEDELLSEDLDGVIIQPLIDFEYEVSFYYINDSFQYALYAPDKEKRWQLAEYTPSEEDLLFADKFIRWNQMKCGITRVDACRAGNELLLVELEDLNPYLSIDSLSDTAKSKFIENFINAIKSELS